AYVSQQFAHSWLNVAALEVNSGPRFDISGGGVNLVSARPYAVATEVLLGNRQYLGSLGAGVSLDRPIVEGLNAGAFYEFRAQRFPWPPEFGVGPLVVTPLVYRIYSWDTEPNPLFNPTLRGSTKEWRYGLTAKLGLTDNIATNLHVIQEDTATNLPATRTRNTQ